MQQDAAIETEQTRVLETVVPVTERKNGQRPKESEHGFRRLMHDLHDFGVLAMADRYRLFGRFLAYHDWDFNDWEQERPLLGDGHVLNVVKGTELVVAAIKWAEQRGIKIPQFIDLYGFADQYFSSQQHLLRKPTEALNSDEREIVDALSAWDTMGKNDRAGVVYNTALRAAEAHDLANLIKSVNDWIALKDPSRKTSDPVDPNDPKSPPIVEYYDRMHYDDVEAIEAHMFKRSLDAFKNELGWTPQQLAVAKVLGADMIRKTEFVPQHLPEGIAGIDRWNSMFNARALWAVFGLVNEYRVRVEQGDQLHFPDFNPQVFFGRFVPGQFETLDQKHGGPPGTSLWEFLEFVDGYRRDNPDEFCRILGVPTERWTDAGRIDNLYDFVTERFKMQQVAAKLFWPHPGNVRYEDAFRGWSEETFARMESACRLFQENFWNPEYTVEQFQRQIDSIAPNRR